MAIVPRRSGFTPPPNPLVQQAVPVMTVMLASLLALMPYIATVPIVPPFGFLVLLSWRLLRTDLWPVWAALPLGAFDDLFNGAPIGTSMALWTIVFVAIDLADRRVVWRNHRQDWMIAAAAIAFVLLGTLAVENLTGGGTPALLLVPQLIVSVLVFPIVSRLTAALDGVRLGR